MEEQLKELATQGLSKALEYIETTEAFVVEQAPLLIQEILNYGLAYSAVFLVVWGLFAIACGVVAYKSCRAVIKSDDGELVPLILVFIGGPGLGFLVGAVQSLLTIAKITFAPRLYLLQELKSLL